MAGTKAKQKIEDILLYDIMDKGFSALQHLNTEISFSKNSPAKLYSTDDINMYKIKDFSIKFLHSSSQKHKTFSDNVFILDLDMLDSHYHLLLDYIGQYFLLKQRFSNLKPVFVTYQHGEEKKLIKDHSRLSKNMYKVLDLAGLSCEEIVDLKEFSSITFKETSFINVFQNQYLAEIGDKVFASSDMSYAAKPLKALFGIKEKSKNKKKFFITRMSENTALRKLIGETERYIIKEMISYLRETTFYRESHKYCRRISLEDEVFLETFFKNNGYEIINPSDYEFREQVEIFSSATHIAGLAGAGFINAIFPNHRAKVFILNPNTEYNFDHGSIPKILGHHVYYVPELKKKNEKSYRFSVKEIINSLPLDEI
jgi:hypothetical protein